MDSANESQAVNSDVPASENPVVPDSVEPTDSVSEEPAVPAEEPLYPKKPEDSVPEPFYMKVLCTVLYMLFPPLWAAAFLGLPLYKKNFKNKATTFFNCYILPPALVIAVFMVIFHRQGIYPFGNKTIAWCDMTQQGVPYWINFKQVLERDQNLFLDMSFAAGTDGWSLLRSYFLYPFSYLILLVDSTEVMYFVSVVTVLKLAACCLTAMIFFRVCVKKLHPAIAAALSMMYSFCAYGLMYYQILNWPNCMYIMPLYFTGIYLLLKKRKILLFSVTVALVMRNFAFGYMAVIATLLFVGYYLIVCDDKEEARRGAFNFSVASAFGAILSIPIWLPFFGTFTKSARGVDVGNALETSVNFTSKNTVYPLLMSTAIIFVTALLFKAIKKKPMEKALYFLFGIMLIPMVFEPINKMWHYGSYTGFPARYAYIIVFAGLAIAGVFLARTETYDLRALRGVTADRKNRLLVYLLSSAFLTLLIYGLYKFVIKYVNTNIKAMDAYATTLWGDSTSYKHMLVMMAFFLSAYALGIAMYRRRLLNKQLFALALIAILVCEGYVGIRTYVVPPTSKMNMENYEKYADLTDRIEDDGFFRVKNAGYLSAAYGSVSEANFPSTLGYNSMGQYSSLTSEAYLYAAKAYGYSSVWMKTESFGGTKFSDALFSVKYKIQKTSAKPKNIVYANDTYCIAETGTYLPLGVFTGNDDVAVDLEEFTRIELQEYVFKSVTGSEENLFSEFKPESVSGCTLKNSNGKYVIKREKDSAYIDYTVKIEGTKTLYFDCFDKFSNSLSEKINDSFAVSVDGKTVQSKFPLDTKNGLLDLGTFTDTTVKVRLKALKDVSCRSFGLFALDDELLFRELNNVESAGLELDGNKITGSFNSADDGYLFVSVPYSSGFKCKVNGSSVKVENCFGGFIGIPVEKGENSITLSFTSPMFYSSIFACIAAIAVVALLVFVFRKRGIRNAYDAVGSIIGEKGVGVLSKIAYVCVILAFIVVLLFVYVYPTYMALKF